MPHKHTTFLLTLVAATVVSLSPALLMAQSYTGSPVTKPRLIRTVQSKQFAVPIIVKQIKLSGVDFELTPAVQSELAGIGTNSQIITAVRENYRYERRTPGKDPKPSPPVPANNADEKYEDTYFSAQRTAAMLRTATSIEQAKGYSDSIIEAATQMTRSNPSRPEAYALLALTNVFMHKFPEAERYAQMTIDRGGSIAFEVWHLSGTPHQEVLHVGKGFVTIESSQKFFQYDGTRILGLNLENDFNDGNRRSAVFSLSTSKDGGVDKWFFAPGLTNMHQEANLIISLVRKNTFGR
ncbi:MAG TPA: hypothetical protein VJV05_00590 [Pyrinomonadaceae bacterium]|nr:hypothetical protein [Pyrinomonadaceae bacterium]